MAIMQAGRQEASGGAKYFPRNLNSIRKQLLMGRRSASVENKKKGEREREKRTQAAAALSNFGNFAMCKSTKCPNLIFQSRAFFKKFHNHSTTFNVNIFLLVTH